MLALQPMAAASPNQPEYIVGLNNNPRGPFNRDDLILLARGGLLNEKTRIFVKGWERWKTMGEVDELSTLLADHPPAVHAASSSSSSTSSQPAASAGSSLDKEIRAALQELKAPLEAVVNGQAGIQTALSALLEAQAQSTRQIADQSKKEAGTLLESLKAGLVQPLLSLENQQKELLQKVEAQQAGRADEAKARQSAFEGLQVTLKAEKEKELLAFSERVEDMDRRFGALQQAFYLSVEQFKKETTAALSGHGEAAAQKQAETLRILEERHQSLMVAQKAASEEMARQLAALAGELQETPGRLAEATVPVLQEQKAQLGLVQAREAETARALVEIGERMNTWDKNWPAQLEAIARGVRETPDLLEKTLAGIRNEQKAFSGKFEEARQGADSQAQSLQIRLDAQLQTLLAAVESRGAVLAADMEQRGQAFGEAVADLRAGIKEFEDITLERYHVLLAAADDQRAIPERVHQLMGQWSGEMKDLVEKVRVGLASVQEFGRAQAEHIYEELGSANQEQLHRQQTSDKERQEQFTLLSQALNRMVTHLEGDLPAHLSRLEAQVEVGAKKIQGVVDQKNTELVSALTTRSEKSEEESRKRHAEMQEVFRGVREGLVAGLGEQQKQLALFQDSHRGDLQEMSSLLLGAAEKGMDSVRELAAQHLAARDTTLQSLTHLGGWAQSLHEKMDKGLAHSLAETAKAQAELRNLMASAHEATTRALAAQEKAGDQRHKEALKVLAEIEAGIPERIGGELRGVAALVEKVAGDGQKRISAELVSALGQVQSGQEAAQKSLSAELASAVGEITQTQQALQKRLSEEWNGVWSERWTVLGADLSRMEKEAAARRDQLAARLAALEGAIPAAVASQIKAQSEEMQNGLKGLSAAIQKQQNLADASRQELEKWISSHFAGQKIAVEQLLKVVQEDVSSMRTAAPIQQKALVEELHKSVSRLPDFMAESYRVTNNAMQKQLAEMAQDVSQATQHVEHSRSMLEKVGSSHLASLQEASEASRQQVAAVIREAKEERTQIQAQLLQELKNWQFEQKKILAAILKGGKGPA